MSSETKSHSEVKAPSPAVGLPGVSSERLAEWSAWRDLRLKRLHHDDGWLTLCGLDWLAEGENSVGSDEKSTIRLPDCCASNVASITLNKDETVRIVPASGVSLHANNVLVPPTGAELKVDSHPPATVVRVPNAASGTPDRVSFFVIKRDTKIGIRMKDKENPVFVNFSGLEYFPFSNEWVVPATYRPHPDGTRVLPTENMYGLKDPQTSPGILEFTHEGKQYTLDVVEEQGETDRFFILFKDKTNGKDTYGMRYMYCPRPKPSSNTTVIDFNTCYSPPCCFTPFATCAIPPKQNHLPFRVDAGEKMYGKQH